MIRFSLLSFFVIFTVCCFCGKDLGRHTSRCRSRLNRNSESVFANAATSSSANNNFEHICNTTAVRCSCGKSCKGVRELKMHQRSCCIIRGLQSETLERLEEELVQTLENESGLDISELDQSNLEDCFAKKGVQLPRTPQQWLNANDFFEAAFSNTPITAASLNHVVCNMNNVLHQGCPTRGPPCYLVWLTLRLKLLKNYRRTQCAFLFNLLFFFRASKCLYLCI